MHANGRATVSPNIHDPAWEDCLLGACMVGKPEVAKWTIANVPSEAFLSNGRRLIYKAIASLTERGAEADLVTVSAELRAQGNDERITPDQLIYIADFVPSGSQYAYYARELMNRYNRRRLSFALSGMIDDLSAGEDAEEAFEKCACLLDAARPAEAEEQFVKLADIKEKEICWLAHPFLARGKFHLLIGDPGEGKSTVVYAIAAALSNGVSLPGCPPIRPMNVMIINTEDGLEDTVKPRMRSLAADQNRVFCYKAPDDGNGFLMLNSAGLSAIERKILKHEIGFVAMDPVISLLDPKMDMHRQNETRAILRRAGRMIERANACGVAVMHMNKSDSTKAIYKAMGSIDFAAFARIAMMAGHDPDDKTRRALTVYKSNIGPTGASLGYSIDDGLFRFTGRSDLDSDRMLDKRAEGAQGRARAQAGVWILELLADSPMASLEIASLAKEQGITAGTLRRAREEAGVVCHRIGAGEQGIWYWALNEAQWSDFRYRQGRPQGEKYDPLSDIE